MATGLATSRRQALDERLVISRTEEGFRVYAPSDPRTRYIVSGSPDSPQCTCPLFQERDDPELVCAHILAVLRECSEIVMGSSSGDDHAAEERQAIQEEGKKSRRQRVQAPSNGNDTGKAEQPTLLTLKRSVSPDGRIDSLSVELTSPVDVDDANATQQRAMRLLAAEAAIVGIFKEASAPQADNRQNGQHRTSAANGHGNGSQQTNGNRQARGNGEARRNWPQHRGQTFTGESTAVPAVVVDVAGLDGKWGRRLFLNIEIDGRLQKLFGSAKELAEQLSGIGFTSNAAQISEGLFIDVPCLATLRPSADGRYQNVHRLLPESGNGQ